MKNFGVMTVVVAMVLLACDDVRACGCPLLAPDAGDEVFKAAVTKEYENAAAVFSGEVVAEEYKPVESDGVAGREVLVIKLAAGRWWKGGAVNQVILYTQTYRYPDGSGSSTSCDYNFKKGEKYLVYASGRADTLNTHACARTRLMEHAARDIKALDEIARDGNGR